MRLGVLDQSPISEGSTGAEALAHTLDLARRCDGLGYHRYWVAEHHGGPMLAGTSPEALIGPIASITSRVRVGSGGVMLPHYSPFKVAETFSLLSGLFPGRIDVGVGRTSGADEVATFALQRERRYPAADDFPQQLAELLSYLDGSIAPEHPLAPLADVLPGRPERPEPWLLGSSSDSAHWAAQVGLPYAFGDFINPFGPRFAELYRQRFAPSEMMSEPRVVVAVSALCADSDEEAQALASSGRMSAILQREGRLTPVPSVGTAQRFLAEREGEESHPGERRRRAVVGDPATVRAGLEQVAELYGAEEILVVTITHDHVARVRSYELIADAFGLSSAVPTPATPARQRP
ncbi:MAG TPA: LLM class flavin-dependent oxidoreductase [Solirubrobacteraceae bacterium]|nr:LLM class flavin-dependent oxidoreductase [Solirubrobacteraceae bacterium]